MRLIDDSCQVCVSLYDAGLHNRSRNWVRNWVHFWIWPSRDYFLSTPPTRKTTIAPLLRLKFLGRHVLRLPRTDQITTATFPRSSCSNTLPPSPPAEKATARQDQAGKG